MEVLIPMTESVCNGTWNGSDIYSWEQQRVDRVEVEGFKTVPPHVVGGEGAVNNDLVRWMDERRQMRVHVNIVANNGRTSVGWGSAWGAKNQNFWKEMHLLLGWNKCALPEKEHDIERLGIAFIDNIDGCCFLEWMERYHTAKLSVLMVQLKVMTYERYCSSHNTHSWVNTDIVTFLAAKVQTNSEPETWQLG